MANELDAKREEIYNIVLAARTEGIIGGKTKQFARWETDLILSKLFTPEQLKELEAGGKIGVVAVNQSLPKIDTPNFGRNVSPNWEEGYRDSQKDMANFRRVVKK